MCDLGIEVPLDAILFFDMDGTLINTDHANFLSYKKAIESVLGTTFDVPFDPKIRFNRSTLKTALPELTDTQLKMIIEKKEKHFFEFLSHTKLNYRVHEILLKYSGRNTTILVTNCRKDRALMTLRHYGLIDKFSKVYFREFGDKDERVNKFQNAISDLGVSPKKVVVFENEESEIRDAVKAGIEIINPKIVQ